MSATPRPWKAEEYSAGTDIIGSNGRMVAFLPLAGEEKERIKKEIRANYTLILEAVNAYDTLKAEHARLSKLAGQFRDLARALYENPDEVATHVNWKGWVDEAEAALRGEGKETP